MFSTGFNSGERGQRHHDGDVARAAQAAGGLEPAGGGTATADLKDAKALLDELR